MKSAADNQEFIVTVPSGRYYRIARRDGCWPFGAFANIVRSETRSVHKPLSTVMGPYTIDLITPAPSRST